MSEIPSSGYYKLGQILKSKMLTVNGFIGWVCIQEGTINNNPWSPNKKYALNTLVFANEKVN